MAEKQQHKHVTVPALCVFAPALIGFAALLLADLGFTGAAAVEGLLAGGTFLAGACRVSVCWR